jgi:hypothetical protein
MRWLIASALTAVGLVGLGYVHLFGNPRVEPPQGLGTLLQDASISSGWLVARLVLSRKTMCGCRIVKRIVKLSKFTE